MRRVLAILASLTLLSLAFTGTVLGAPADRTSGSQTIVFCELVSDDGTVRTFVGASDEFGSFGVLEFWAAPANPETDDPTWISGNSVVLLEGSSLMAQIDLFEFPEPVGDPLGIATMTATLTPVGDPTTIRFQDHFGNQTLVVRVTHQDLAIAGTLDLPEGISYDLDSDSCVAASETRTILETHPASGISHSEQQLQLGCFWETGDGFVNLSAFVSEDGEVFADIFVSDPSGEYFGFNEAILTTSEFAASWDLFPLGEEEEPAPVGTAEAAATLTVGDRINDMFSFGPFKVHITGQGYNVDGTLTLTTPNGTQELTMDAVSCFAGDVRITEHFSPSQGGGGKPLPNDTPDTAEPISVGDSVEVRTGGTDVEPEAPCLVDDEFEVPLGHTAWWTFEGTGGDVTVDTAGSDFDTVLSIYTDDGAGGLTQVACVDDVETLQAVVTVATEAGVTYYIQAGGFAAQSGTLVLSVSS